MKLRYFIMAMLCLIVISCQKQTITGVEESYLENVKIELSHKLSSDDFNKLDISHAVLSKVDSLGLYFFQIPFIDQKEFVLIKTNTSGIIEEGKIIRINRKAVENGNLQFDGSILIQSLSRTVELKSPIEAGYIKSLQINDSTNRTAYVQPDPYIELPEVIVVSSYSSGGGISLSTWYSVMDLLGINYTGGGRWYAPAESTGGGGSTSTGSSGYGDDYPVTKNPIYVSEETQVNDPAINLQNFINCFNSIPDAGSVCKITIHSDIPVNGDPNKFFNFNTGSPGHAWLCFQKSNGSKFVSQYIGFYPATDWKTVTTTAPITGKFVDNGKHEFNASYQVTITPAQLQDGFTRMLYLQRFVKYDMDDYNCTDWALEVFNEVVGPQKMLSIPKYNIPGGMAPYGTNTPQGLFIKLREMKEAGGTSGILIPVVGYSGGSTGPCGPTLVE